MGLYKDPITEIIAPEFFWRAAFLGFEGAVEIGHIIKAALKCNFRHGFCGVQQHPGDMAQSNFIQAVDKAIAGTFFYESAEGSFGHVGYF